MKQTQKQKLLDLALKKQRLLMASAAQREQLALHAAGVQPLFSGADKVVTGLLWLRQHPLLIAASSAAVFILRPRFLVRLATRGYSTWQLIQAFRGRIRR